MLRMRLWFPQNILYLMINYFLPFSIISPKFGLILLRVKKLSVDNYIVGYDSNQNVDLKN